MAFDWNENGYDMRTNALYGMEFCMFAVSVVDVEALEKKRGPESWREFGLVSAHGLNVEGGGWD